MTSDSPINDAAVEEANRPLGVSYDIVVLGDQEDRPSLLFHRDEEPHDFVCGQQLLFSGREGKPPRAGFQRGQREKGPRKRIWSIIEARQSTNRRVIHAFSFEDPQMKKHV